MRPPDLRAVVQWLGPERIDALDRRRRRRREYQRRRQLATTETLWLMLAVSLDTTRRSLYEILQLATVDLNLSWAVSTSAFCQARDRFSPRQLALDARPGSRRTDSPN